MVVELTNNNIIRVKIILLLALLEDKTWIEQEGWNNFNTFSQSEPTTREIFSQTPHN